MRPELIAVGVGPGAPDLLTLRAIEKIRSAREIADTAKSFFLPRAPRSYTAPGSACCRQSRAIVKSKFVPGSAP